MKRLASTLLLASALSFSGCDIDEFMDSNRFKEDAKFNLNLRSGGRLEIENFNGGIEITGWDRESVEVLATKYAATQDLLDSLKIDVSNPTSDSVRIRSIRPNERRGHMGVRYVISVPRRVVLDRIVSSNGPVRIQQVEGNVRVRTSNGPVRASNLKGDLEAVTSNGPVELTEFTGAVNVTTSNGPIRADNVRGYFEAHTSNGPISARLIEITGSRPIRAESSNGSVSLTLENWKSNDIYASTSNSSVTVRLPANVNASLKATTSNSSITSEFDVNTRGTLSKNRLEGTIGSGGPVLDLHTSNGSIKIMKGTFVQ